MIRRPPRSTRVRSSAASDVYKRQGDTYTDLGAIVHDNQGHDLSYRTFINGVPSGNILIDTSQVATDTIDYVATDTWGQHRHQHPHHYHQGRRLFLIGGPMSEDTSGRRRSVS